MLKKTDWKNNHLLVAEKLVKHIAREGEVTIDAIDARARGRIPMSVLDQALEKIHRMKTVKRTVKRGTVWYSIQEVKKPKPPGSHLTWVRNNYPVMDSTNDGSGLEADYSYMFLTPEQMKVYKAEAKGMPLHMMKRKPCWD